MRNNKDEEEFSGLIISERVIIPSLLFRQYLSWIIASNSALFILFINRWQMQPASRIYKAKLQSLFFSFFVFLPETCFTSSPDYHAALCWVILPNVSRLHPTTRKKQRHYRLIGGCRAPQGELLAAIILSFSPSFCFSFSSCMAAVWRLIRAHADVSQSIFSKKKKTFYE